MVLEVDETKVLKLAQDHLPEGWRGLRAYPLLQNMGSRWYHDQASLALEVPSAVIPQESNFIINTIHPDFQENVRIAETENYFWDKRL